MPKKYRKKPVVIEALQFTGDNYREVCKWVGGDAEISTSLTDDIVNLTIKTLEGPLHASTGDWIIKGVKGEFYPCKPDIFASIYEQVQ